MLKEDYQEKVEQLTAMVDMTLSRVEFLRISGPCYKMVYLATCANTTSMQVFTAYNESCLHNLFVVAAALLLLLLLLYFLSGSIMLIVIFITS